MPSKPDLPILQCDSRAIWTDWLAGNHSESTGVRLKFAKRGSPTGTVTHAEALEEALRFGWIDGQVQRFDEHFFLQRFAPRSRRSKWSQVNRASAERLIAEQRMEPPGLAAVEAARADGRWEAAYAPQSTATVPPDLQEALDANQTAKAFFETLSGVNRYAILYRISDAKRPETRARRIEKFVQMCAEHRTVH